jgi:hypothetical protein
MDVAIPLKEYIPLQNVHAEDVAGNQSSLVLIYIVDICNKDV